MNLHQKKIEGAIASLNERVLTNGGFAELPKNMYRVDSTAWAVIALTLAGASDENVVAAARARLAASQLQDGRVSISEEHPSAFWPTALAVLAWQRSAAQRKAHALATSFLLNTAGKPSKKTPEGPIADDFTIQAWPWIENASAWVEPTALAVIALRTAGHETHPRAREAVRMLMDRQLPHGGWNYGNTVVYGSELYPQIGSTGIALAALAGQVDGAETRKSLDYLTNSTPHCRSPFSLGWALIGLSAWGGKPGQSSAWIVECLDQQRKYGVYGTSILSLLIASFFIENDIAEHIQKG
jgi:hypothetical protein